MFNETNLFKFVRSASAVESMLEGKLRFSKTDELNDPCELVDEINESMVANSLIEFREKGYSDAEYQWLCRQDALLQSVSPQNQAIRVPNSKESAHRQILSSFYDDLARMASLQRDAVKNIKEKAGILSLTSNWSSLPMWAHYADNAKGYVVIFNELDKAFSGDETGVLDEVVDVEYSDSFEGVTFKPSSQRNLFFWKFLDWSYEREVRVVSSLNKCQKTFVGSNSMWLRRIAPKYVSGVIIGWNADKDSRSRLKKFCSNSKREIQLFEAGVSGVSVTISEALT